MKEILQRFGVRLAALRRKRGKTQEELEHQGAAHRTYVSELERGEKEPSLGTILKLAGALDVSPASLVAGLIGETAAEEDGSALAHMLTNALQGLPSDREAGEMSVEFASNDTLDCVEEAIKSIGSSVGDVLAEATRLCFKTDQRNQRDSLEYLLADRRSPAALVYTDSQALVMESLDPPTVLAAVRESNRVLELLHDMAVRNGVPIFALLGMRNLSSFVGEIFKSELCKLALDRFAPNPHQDGYPDLLALTPEGVKYMAERARLGQLSDKSFWSPFPYGGVEVKATCGNTPPAKKMPKPGIGESRWPILLSAEWKAHHRKTNNLIGIFWDFIDGLPTVLAAFYRNDLTIEDWGEVIKPKTDASSTTSVSIMRRGRVGQEVGVKKMARGWIVLPKDPEIRAALTQRNVFHLEDTEIVAVTSQSIPLVP